MWHEKMVEMKIFWRMLKEVMCGEGYLCDITMCCNM